VRRAVREARPAITLADQLNGPARTSRSPSSMTDKCAPQHSSMSRRNKCSPYGQAGRKPWSVWSSPIGPGSERMGEQVLGLLSAFLGVRDVCRASRRTWARGGGAGHRGVLVGIDLLAGLFHLVRTSNETSLPRAGIVWGQGM